MKKFFISRFRFLLFSIPALTIPPLIFFACSGVGSKSGNTAMDLFDSNPPSITWDNDSSNEIKSYQANIEVYSMNNRSSKGAQLADRYRLTISQINGKQYTRLDFDPEFNNGAARSVISDGSELILFDTNTEKIDQRISIADRVSPDLKLFTGDTYLSRVNLALIRKEAQRLSFDVSEESSENALLINIPEKLLLKSPNVKQRSTSILFDTAEETLVATETVEKHEDGTEVTTTTEPVYIEENDVPVKVGEITVIDTVAPVLAGGTEIDSTVINTPDDVPTIDQSAADKMIAEGSAVKADEITFGNPADLSNTTSIVTMCKDIELNRADSRLFKIMTGEK